MRRTVNSQEVDINIVGSSVFGLRPKINAEKTYNMFISDGWIVNFAGWTRVKEIFTTGQGRGLFASSRGNLMVAVWGSAVYKIDPNLNATFVGSLNTQSGEISMDENLNNQICIVDGVNAYIYNYTLGANLTVQTQGALSSPDTLIPNYVSFHNTFFNFGNASQVAANGSFWYSYVFDTPTTIRQTLNQATALQTKPDNALAVVRIPSQGNNILVLGKTVSEIWNQVGGLENYRRNSSVNIDYGCLSINTIAASDEYVAWLGINNTNSPVIIMFAGQKANFISTDGINNLLDNLVHPEISTAIFYRQDGHLFYQLTFFDTQDNLTLTYDVKEGKFYHLSDQDTNYHPARQIVYFNNESYFVSLNNASLYQIKTEFTKINENIPITPQDSFQDPRLVHEIPRIRICKNIRLNKSTPFIANTVVITIENGVDVGQGIDNCETILVTEEGIPIVDETGIQLVTEDSFDIDCALNNPNLPRIDLAISKTGGETYSNYVARQLNDLGHFQSIVKWERMGITNDITFKFKFWGLGRFTVWDGVLDMIPVDGQGSKAA